MTIKLSAHGGGGDVTLYAPAMHRFDGPYLTEFPQTYFSSSSNKFEMWGLADIDLFNSTPHERVFTYYRNISFRGAAVVYSYDNSSIEHREKISFSASSATGVQLMAIVSDIPVCGIGRFSYYCSYNGDTGEGVMRINGRDAIDTGFSGHTLIAGTLDTLPNTVSFGAWVGGGENPEGSLGFIGYHDQILGYDYYFDTHGYPKDIDGSGLMMLFRHGTYLNEGTGANLNQVNGSVTPNDAGAHVSLPAALGLPTVGDATEADIAAGKIAWVDGVKIVGTAS